MDIVIGAGPAGIQMASYLDNHIVLEKSSSVCSFFRSFPRHRRFISFNKNKDLRFDWNSFLNDTHSMNEYSDDLFPSANDYIKYVEDFVKRKNINIRTNYEVRKIEKINETFVINDGEYEAKRLFIGTGLVPRNIDLKVHPSFIHYSYDNMPLDKNIYKDKNIFIIGYGNAALETANWLTNIASKVMIFGKQNNAFDSHYPGYARSNNFTAIDAMFLKLGTFITYTNPNDTRPFRESELFDVIKNSIESGNIPLAYPKPDIIISCTGFTYDNSLVKNLVNIDISTGFPILTNNFESEKCPGLFFIGAITQNKDYKKGTSSFIHGFRYNCEYLHRYINGISFDVMSKDDMIRQVFMQLNTSSCLLHRFDEFCDVIEKLPDGNWKYIKEVPFPHKVPHDGFTIRLGYSHSKQRYNTFNVFGSMLPSWAPESIFIHPIIESGDKTIHLPEDITNNYSTTEGHFNLFLTFIEYLEGTKTFDELNKYIYEEATSIQSRVQEFDSI